MHSDGDRLLQLLFASEEFLIGAGHQPVSITSLPFVHTARRYYRLNVLVRSSDCLVLLGSWVHFLRSLRQESSESKE